LLITSCNNKSSRYHLFCNYLI